MSDDREEIAGPDVTIVFETKKCIHSRGCVLGRPDVFVPNVKGPWIHPEAATAEEVAELAHNCPSGAITYLRRDGINERAPVVNLVRIRENGPYAFHGALAIEGHGTAFRATLCRCGQSSNKPFCDSAHKTAGFTATGEPDGDPSEPLAARDGTLTIAPRLNGPLIVKGNFEVVSGTGRTIDRCTKAALCRCGHSHTKPFCDGTHKEIGFVAPGSTP
jgi:CDGSH-type Zn-finger protein/uncharacterized Fe-S cluster protein YjdI